MKRMRWLLTVAFPLILTLAQPSLAQSDVDPGSAAFMHGDYATAMQEWWKKAKAGDAEAINNIGVLYNKGLGVDRDPTKAAEWYQRAAEFGYPNAQFNLANLYYSGEGVEKNAKQAAYWYQQAAERGHLGAQYYLGLMYEDGEGVPQDQMMALKWIVKAADAGNAAAQYEVGRMLVTGDGLQPDAKKGADYALKSAQAGNSKAALLMAQIYESGNGADKNDIEAYVWARIALDRLKPGQDSKKASALVDDLEGRMEPGAIKAAERVIAIRNPKPEDATQGNAAPPQ